MLTGAYSGALLNSVPEDDDASKFDFMGSTLVCIAESKEEIMADLKKDIYATSGVWDVEKVSRLRNSITPSSRTHAARPKFTPSSVPLDTHE